MTATGAEYDDPGGASRFFYVAKADATERPCVNGTAHLTVKPLDLMRWLVRLCHTTGRHRPRTVRVPVPAPPLRRASRRTCAASRLSGRPIICRLLMNASTATI